jgi:SmpA / OmlA family
MGVLVSAVFLFACAGSFQRMNHLKLGMTKQEVIQTIGTPDITSASGHVEYLKYRSNAGMFYTDEYYVRLLDGKVDAYGQQGDFNLPY